MPNEEITNCDELDEAVGEYQAGGEHDPNEERYLINKAVELGCTEKIPDDFGLAYGRNHGRRQDRRQG